MNPTLVLPTAPSTWPVCVTVNWRRLSSGLWRVPEGDMHATYSAESFPRVAVFTHEGRLFTSCGMHYYGSVHAEADCYPLIPPDDYCGPEPLQYSYKGREVAYRGQVFRLGPKVIFKASDPTVEEWRTLFRVLYVDGGRFAARRTYVEFLDQKFSPQSDTEQTARLKEIAEWGVRSLPETQEEMRRVLEREVNAAGVDEHPKPIDFAL